MPNKSIIPRSIIQGRCLLAALLAISTGLQARAENLPFDAQQLERRAIQLARSYFAEFQHPETFVLYGAKLSTKDRWTTPGEVKARQPKPWGYGSRIADTALHCGHTLVALLDAHDAAPNPYWKQKASELFHALKFIGEVCPVDGLVPRGPHPDDPTAYYDDSSMDQHTTYIIALARYAQSGLASAADKDWIAHKLNAIGRRLEMHDFSIKTADGVTQSHVGFSWTGFRHNHASILIPTLYALHVGTGDPHWRKRHDELLAEREGLRWKLLHAGDHVELNGHPIYANQNGFRMNAYLRLLEEPHRRSVILGLLSQSAQMQLNRPFPGPFYRKFHREQDWKELARERRWPTPELRGAEEAWRLFDPAALDEKGGLAALAHVRFPMGGFHLSLMSADPKLIRRDLPTIWEMLTTVDLEKIAAAETHYLFTTVALHAHAACQQHPEWFSNDPQYGATLETEHDVGIGPTMDVTIQGDRVLAIGNRALHVLDASNPARPKPIGRLNGLGRVRQLVVDNDHAYLVSREDGLFIVNIADPANPTLTSRHDTIEFATGVEKSGDVLYVACRSFGVELIDVSEPEAPRHLSLVRTGEAQSVVERDGILYAGVWAASQVVSVDVRNPWKPRILSRAPLDGYGDGVDVHDGFLFAATGHHSSKRPRSKEGDPGYGKGHGLEILSLSDPAAPRSIARVKFPAGYDIHNDMWSVTIANAHAFVADTHNGVFVLDVRQPSQPRFTGHWKPPTSESGKRPNFVGGLCPGDGYIYVACGQSDLHVVAAPDMARAPSPRRTHAAAIPPRPAVKPGLPYRRYSCRGQIYSVDFAGETAIAACGVDGVHALRISPDFELRSERATNGKATDVCVSGDRIYVAEGDAGLGIYQLQQSGTLRELGRYRASSGGIRQVEAPGSSPFVIAQVGIHKIHIIDVSDASKPRRVLEDQNPGLLYGDQLMRGILDGRYTCAFWHVSGLHWYDLQADGGPARSGDNFPGRIGSGNGLIEFQNQTLAATRGGYHLLQRGEQRAMTELPLRRIGNRRANLGKPEIDGNRLYLADRQSGIVTIVDIAEPAQPGLIEQFELPGNPARPVIHNGTLVIADGYHGLLVFDR